MKEVKDIDIAFLSTNQPYTMTVEQLIHAIQMVHPQIVYPYHYSETDFTQLINDKPLNKEFDIRLRKLP